MYAKIRGTKIMPVGVLNKNEEEICIMLKNTQNEVLSVELMCLITWLQKKKIIFNLFIMKVEIFHKKCIFKCKRKNYKKTRA